MQLLLCVLQCVHCVISGAVCGLCLSVMCHSSLSLLARTPWKTCLCNSVGPFPGWWNVKQKNKNKRGSINNILFCLFFFASGKILDGNGDAGTGLGSAAFRFYGSKCVSKVRWLDKSVCEAFAMEMNWWIFGPVEVALSGGLLLQLYVSDGAADCLFASFPVTIFV